MTTRLSTDLSVAYERAVALGPFDPERYVKGLEALGDMVRATIEPDGRQGYYNFNPRGVGGAVERLALEIWSSWDPDSYNAVVRYLIDSGRVEAEPTATVH